MKNVIVSVSTFLRFFVLLFGVLAGKSFTLEYDYFELDHSPSISVGHRVVKLAVSLW